jgi:uncharacterized protein (TIGR02246 family)
MVRARTMALGCGLLGAAGCWGARGSAPRTAAADRELAAIERLHRQDVAATVPGDARLLAELWTDDAVRIGPGGRIHAGKAAIRAADERATARHPQGRVLTYVPVIEDLRVAGEWAFEWGRFTSTYQENPTAKVEAVRGTVLRVLRRQVDGSWKFARLMVQVE